MYISTKDWKAYIDKLSMLNNEASRLMIEYVQKNGFGDRNALIDYAYALVNKYGRGSAALSAAMYDAVAEVSGKFYAPAEIVDDVSVEDVAKTVNGTLKRSKNIDELGGAVSRLVKRQGADTTLYNARRDGAEFAWIPVGDTCSFCLMLASNGWQHVSKKTLKNGHAEHIHSNCDCNYAVRFSDNDGVEGYDPDVYKEIYDNAEGDTWQEKLNSMRREKYAKNKDEINSQKRMNYAERKLVETVQKQDRNKLPLTISLPDELIHKSVGAKSKNYDIMDLDTGEMYQLVEGEYIRNKVVFAGKGVRKPYNKAQFYADRYGGNAADWKHVKGIGVIDTEDGHRKAEIHWSECDGIGAVEHFIKEWLDES